MKYYFYRQCFFVLPGLIVLFCIACTPTPLPSPSDPEAQSPVPSPTVACSVRLVPLPTGEKYSELIIKTAPPAQAHPGQSIVLEFEEGYGLIVKHAKICGEDQVVGYGFADELPTFETERTVRVYLDNQPWTVLSCQKVCRIDLVIPTRLSPGEHLIRVQFPIVNDTLFAIEIVE